MQFDLFVDVSDTGMRHDACQAILRHDLSAAEHACQQLRSHFPRDTALPALHTLLSCLVQDASPVLNEHSSAMRAIEQLQAARQSALLLLEAQGLPWLQTLWKRMAERLDLPYTTQFPQAQRAFLCLRAADWPGASQAVEHISNWRRLPHPLSWMAQIKHKLEGLDSAWPLLAELAWCAPELFAATLARLEEPRLQRQQQTFLREFDETDQQQGAAWAWFPAWVCLHTPELAAPLRTCKPGSHSRAEQAAMLVLELLAVEKRGQHQEMLKLRQRLQSLHADLFQHYMRSR